MIVAIRDIKALCVGCSGEEFEQLAAGELNLSSVLKCSGCSAQYTYLQLLDRIGEEAIRRANKARAEPQKRPSPK